MKGKCYVPCFDWLDSAARVSAYEVTLHQESAHGFSSFISVSSA